MKGELCEGGYVSDLPDVKKPIVILSESSASRENGQLARLGEGRVENYHCGAFLPMVRLLTVTSCTRKK